MPLYEYHCRRCDKTFELIQRFSDEPLTVHEGCGGDLEKLISRSALRFKGSGWYVNDYGKGRSSQSENGGKKASSDNGGGKTESGKTESGKTESRKTESKAAPPAAEPAGGKPAAKSSKE